MGYTGVIRKRATVSAAFYVNDTKDDIFFTQVASYRATNPPPGWPLPPFVLEALYCPANPPPGRPCPFGAGNGLPAAFSYRNFGKVRQKGPGARHRRRDHEASGARLRTTRSSPSRSRPGFPASELNIPPAQPVQHRA